MAALIVKIAAAAIIQTAPRIFAEAEEAAIGSSALVAKITLDHTAGRAGS